MKIESKQNCDLCARDYWPLLNEPFCYATRYDCVCPVCKKALAKNQENK